MNAGIQTPAAMRGGCGEGAGSGNSLTQRGRRALASPFRRGAEGMVLLPYCSKLFASI
jgi:hypothetical protein